MRFDLETHPQRAAATAAATEEARVVRGSCHDQVGSMYLLQISSIEPVTCGVKLFADGLGLRSRVLKEDGNLKREGR